MATYQGYTSVTVSMRTMSRAGLQHISIWSICSFQQGLSVVISLLLLPATPGARRPVASTLAVAAQVAVLSTGSKIWEKDVGYWAAAHGSVGAPSGSDLDLQNLGCPPWAGSGAVARSQWLFVAILLNLLLRIYCAGCYRCPGCAGHHT